MAEAVTEPLMAVGQAAIGGKTEIREVLVDFSVTAAKAAIEKTGKIETIIEAVRAGQVRSGLGVMDGKVAEQLELAATIEEAKKVINRGPTKTVKKLKTVLASQSQRLQISAPSLSYPLETTLRSASLGKG